MVSWYEFWVEDDKVVKVEHHNNIHPDARARAREVSTGSAGFYVVARDELEAFIGAEEWVKHGCLGANDKDHARRWFEGKELYP